MEVSDSVHPGGGRWVWNGVDGRSPGTSLVVKWRDKTTFRCVVAFVASANEIINGHVMEL